MPPVYALNLFDLADNDLYRQYSRRSVDAVAKHGGRVVALGKLSETAPSRGGEPRQAMVIVEWPSAESFDAFVADPEHEDLHPLREDGTRNYLWWAYDKLEDLRPLLAPSGRSGTAALPAPKPRPEAESISGPASRPKRKRTAG